jgi:hypothetical protein
MLIIKTLIVYSEIIYNLIDFCEEARVSGAEPGSP